ncbi:hypothetical protein AAULR_01535 [Lacticaseibacillus rhamnosus MTCC 5462]|nr:hypothetical protein AAULR_01535 [Lacticaseibacillus rhamnosus MTCC 5462]
MKIQWQKPLIDKRMIVVLLLEVLLLISSLALYLINRIASYYDKFTIR